MIRARTAEQMTPEQVDALLRRAGIQPTAQRIAISRYIFSEPDHVTAEDVKHWADENFPKISLATVYNTLGTLVNAGILREFRFAHIDKVIYDKRTEDHFHFLDVNTGVLHDIDVNGIDIHPKLGEGFRVHSMDVLIKGEITGK